MKQSGLDAGDVNTLQKRSKSLEQQRRSELRQAACAVMDARRDAMEGAEAAAQVQKWIKATWLSALTNLHGLSQAAVL
jgi:hypothetical protein